MRRMSPTLVAVLHAVADGVAYGFDVIDRTGLPSGTVYPALSRLERDGYLRSSWEAEAEAFAAGRPARRYYRTTAAGLRALREAVAAYQALLPARPASGPGAGVTGPAGLPWPWRACCSAPPSALVPADLRRDWRREWDAELAWRLRHGRPAGRAHVALTARVGGAVVHAVWLRCGSMETRDVDL